ncbi:MAG: hypothetical protein QME78_18270 [Thermodesulfobacteriota bacterium]|nr:hypothetical protein [Thermodesulfobacteriota bacterium]
MANHGHAVPRRAGGAGGHAAIQRRTVEIFFQRFPGTGGGSGIRGLEYEVTVGGGPAQRNTTGNDGKVTLRLSPGTNATLRILGSEYEINLAGELQPIAEMRGVQQRLGMLGYYTGPLHGDDRRADTYNNPNEATERAMLSFQADNDLFPDAMFGPQSTRALRGLTR